MYCVTNVVVLACDDLEWLFSVVDEYLEALQVSLRSCQVGRSVSHLVLAVRIYLILDDQLQQRKPHQYTIIWLSTLSLGPILNLLF